MGIKVAFITGPEENMGIKYLSAVLKMHHHQTELFFDPQLFNDEVLSIEPLAKIFSFKDRLVEEIIDYQPDLIGFSVHSDFSLWAGALAAKIKQRTKTPIIFGGIHPSSVPEAIIRMESVDMVCIGEGEYALLELAQNIERSSQALDVQNIWFKKNSQIIRNSLRPLVQVNELPHPDHEIYYNKNKYFGIGYHTIASRGCLYNCSYCCHCLLRRLYSGETNYYRVREVENLIQELVQAKKNFAFKIIRFYDDIFPHQQQWLRRFTDLYKRLIKVPFICYFHPSLVTEENMHLLKGAGCAEIRLGVQSLNQKTRREILNRFEKNQCIEDAIKIVKRCGLKLVTENMLGLPGQSNQDVEQMLEFYNNNRPARNHFFWLRYYPGLEIAKHRSFDSSEYNKRLVNNSPRVFTRGGDTYLSLNHKQVAALYILPLLPQGLAAIFIKKRFWRYLPFSFGLWFLNIFSNFTSGSDSDKIRRTRVLKRYLFFIKQSLTGIVNNNV